MAGVLCLIPLGVGVVSFAVPEVWGEVLLGDTWSVAQPLLPITGVEYFALTWSYSADAILKAQGNSRAVLALQLTHTTMITTCATVAAVMYGSALSVAVGLALGGTIGAVYGIRRTWDPRHSARAM